MSGLGNGLGKLVHFFNCGNHVLGGCGLLCSSRRNFLHDIRCGLDCFRDLGNGCSVTAVKRGRSVDTSMGLTPLEGLVMGTRAGDFDPAVVFYLTDKDYDIKTIKELCNKRSGLLGISGVSNDMRNLIKCAQDGHRRAKLAIDVFCYRVKKYIGAYVAVLEDVDAIVFTGGIGENAAIVRQTVCSDLGAIGIELDQDGNMGAVGTECEISSGTSAIKIFVIPTNEEMAIAKDTYEISMQKVKHDR